MAQVGPTQGPPPGAGFAGGGTIFFFNDRQGPRCKSTEFRPIL
jgi:hypothetical protein